MITTGQAIIQNGFRDRSRIGIGEGASRQRSANVCPPVEERWPLVNEGAQLRLPATGEQGLQIDLVLDFTSSQISNHREVELHSPNGIWNKSLVRSFTSFLNCLSLGSTLPDALDVTKAWYSHFLLAQTCVTAVARCLTSAAREQRDGRSGESSESPRRRFKRFHCSVPTAVRMKPFEQGLD